MWFLDTVCVNKASLTMGVLKWGDRDKKELKISVVLIVCKRSEDGIWHSQEKLGARLQNESDMHRRDG